MPKQKTYPTSPIFYFIYNWNNDTSSKIYTLEEFKEYISKKYFQKDTSNHSRYFYHNSIVQHQNRRFYKDKKIQHYFHLNNNQLLLSWKDNENLTEKDFTLETKRKTTEYFDEETEEYKLSIDYYKIKNLKPNSIIESDGNYIRIISIIDFINENSMTFYENKKWTGLRSNRFLLGSKPRSGKSKNANLGFYRYLESRRNEDLEYFSSIKRKQSQVLDCWGFYRSNMFSKSWKNKKIKHQWQKNLK